MKSIAEIGMKITPRQHEYFRYSGISAAVEAAGNGASHGERFASLEIRPEPAAQGVQSAKPPGSERGTTESLGG